MKTLQCSHEPDHTVAIEDCIKCSRMCINNPGTHTTGIWDRGIVKRWGVDEIEKMIGRRKETKT